MTPAFINAADYCYDVSHGGEDFTAWFRAENPPRFTGMVRNEDDLPMDRDYSVYWVGLDTIEKWEAMAEDRSYDSAPYDPAEPMQRAWDEAREAHDVA